MGSIAIAGSGTSSGVTINTTPIIGGTNLHVLYDNAGTVGEMSMFTNMSGSPNAATAYYCQSKTAVFVVPNAGGDNWFEGEAGNTSLSGNSNFGTGTSALAALTTGSNNTAVGVNAGSATTSGSGNVAIGSGAMQSNITGGSNFAIGNNALNAGTGQSSNVAIGANALASFTGVHGQVAVGGGALAAAISGDDNVAIGFHALTSVVSGQQNVTIGNSAMNNGDYNNAVAIGYRAFSNATAGDYNVFIGHICGGSLTGSGSGNVWLGPFEGVGTVPSTTFALSLGLNNLVLDYAITSAGAWTFASLNSAGLMTTNASGTVSIVSSAPAAAVPANFSATNIVTVNIGGTTYHIPADTATW